MKIKIAVIIGFISLVACFVKTGNNKQDAVKSIEIQYVPPYFLYPSRIACTKTFVKAKDTMFIYKHIKNRDAIKQFDSIYSKLEALENTNYDFDVRIQMLVHKQYTTDTVCMSRNTHIVINGIERKTDPEFFKLIDRLLSDEFKDEE